MSKAKFKKNHFLVIKEAVDPKIAEFVYNYFLMKRQVTKTFQDFRYINPFNIDHGTWNDDQVPNTFSIYADPLMETLLLYVKPKMIKGTKLKLYETYSYARTYKPGDVLEKHKDRPSCEISTTLFLGGDKWPIYLNDGKKDIKINLNEGDMLIYRGCDLEHWRNQFNGEVCVQVFLHYSTNKGLLNDTRPKLGLNAEFKNI